MAIEKRRKSRDQLKFYILTILVILISIFSRKGKQYFLLFRTNENLKLYSAFVLKKRPNVFLTFKSDGGGIKDFIFFSPSSVVFSENHFVRHTRRPISASLPATSLAPAPRNDTVIVIDFKESRRLPSTRLQNARARLTFNTFLPGCPAKPRSWSRDNETNC